MSNVETRPLYRFYTGSYIRKRLKEDEILKEQYQKILKLLGEESEL